MPVLPEVLNSGEVQVDGQGVNLIHVGQGDTLGDLVHAILELHRERDQPHTLWISARAEVARRA
jgi:hypothetical protein